MTVVKSGQKSLEMGNCGQDDEDVKDLVGASQSVNFARVQSFWNSCLAASVGCFEDIKEKLTA